MGKLKVRFDNPENGSIRMQISNEISKLALVISYTPYYLIEELIEAIIKVLDNEGAIANGSYNPERYEFEFKVEKEIVDLQIKSFPDRRHIEGLSEVLFGYRGDKLEICKSF